MKTAKENYIPALRYDCLTSIYDPVVRLTMQEAAFKKALVRAAQIQDQDKILDLACGTGTLSILIKRSFPRAIVTGVDGDLKILQLARAKAHRANAEIKFDRALSFELPYENESFDCVVSSLFFHHLTRTDKRRTLAEVRRILKPSGKLCVADWGLAQNAWSKFGSYAIQLLDGLRTTTDNFNGLLPTLIEEAEFINVEETTYFNSLFGTIRLHQAQKL